MAKIGKKLRSLEGGRVAFSCPGCGEHHHLTITHEKPGACWGYNGNADAPTFTPSVLVKGTRSATTEEMEFGLFERVPFTCHSFITDGRIKFLGDCTHVLAGQTVDLPDI